MKHPLQFLLLATLLFSCSKVQEDTVTSSTSVSLLIDVTDPHLVKPDAEYLLALYTLSEEINKEAWFRLSVVSDKKLNPVVEYHLADGETTEKNNRSGDSQYREKLVYTFYETIRGSLSNFWASHDSLQSLENTECVGSILHELGHLSQSHSTQKFLLVFSDLEQNAAFKSHSKENLNLLNSDPARVAKYFLDQFDIPENLSGITVYFINLPRSREEEALFLQWVEVYKLLLEPHGAHIVVQAHNKFSIP